MLITKKVNIADSGTVSETFKVPKGAAFIYMYAPDLDAGAVGIEASYDNGTNFVPIIDPADGADVVIIADGSDPCYANLTPFLEGFPHNIPMRLTCGAQTGAVDCILYFTA